jgi:CubicO group peptidase (beta-lactamase class C family)
MTVTVSAVWSPGKAAPLNQPLAQSAGTADQAAAIDAIARKAMDQYDLKAVILRVTIDNKDIVTEAMGESMTGVPATTDMHFRNGAVAISYVSTLLLELVDQKKVGLDDKLANWFPDLPEADQVTLRMLANMTSGYADYVIGNDEMSQALYQNPYLQWKPEELIAMGIDKPHVYPPGTNWNYAHTNYVILGQVLEKVTGKPMDLLMQEYIFAPMGLTDTDGPSTPVIREPALHAFTSERRQALGVDPAIPFLEESTYWNPSWTITHGAIQTTNIYDMATTAVAVGTGSLLSPESHQAQVQPQPNGFGTALPGCTTCRTLGTTFNYGLGVFVDGSWILQNPMFYGYAGVEGYLPSKKIAIAVANTYGEKSFDQQGDYKYGNASERIFAAITAYLAPDEALLGNP